MWAQLITTRLKPGREGDLQGLVDLIASEDKTGAVGRASP